jgi:hypothetical protein
VKFLLAFIGGVILGVSGTIGALIALMSDKEPLLVETDQFYPPPRDPYLDDVLAGK